MLAASRIEDQEEGRGHAVALGEQAHRLLQSGEQTRKLRELGERTHKHRWAAEAASSRI